MDIRTLCYRCKQEYESAGYVVSRVHDNNIKDKCEICTNAGYDYYIEERKQDCLMCNHEWQKINSVKVCMNCGMTITPDGKIVFDRKIVNYKPKKRKKVK